MNTEIEKKLEYDKEEAEKMLGKRIENVCLLLSAAKPLFLTSSRDEVALLNKHGVKHGKSGNLNGRRQPFAC